MSVLFYRAEPTRETERPPTPAGYVGEWWRPGDTRLPPNVPTLRYAVWWLFHRLRLFANQDYAVFFVRQGAHRVHRSAVFPRWLRSPFMRRDDLQIGDTWTEANHRGQGLAAFALRHIMADLARPGRAFWYLADEENTSSVRVAERAGLQRVGRGQRMRRLGLAALGYYRLTPPDQG